MIKFLLMNLQFKMSNLSKAEANLKSLTLVYC